MPTRDDHSFARFLLDEVQKIDEYWVDPLPSSEDRQAVAPLPLAVKKGLGLGTEERRIGWIALAPKIFSRDPWKMRLRFPRIDGARRMCWSRKDIKTIACISVDRLCEAISAANLLPLRLFQPRTANGEADYS
jgi:hypothetical protein